jgi:hypothetical protein
MAKTTKVNAEEIQEAPKKSGGPGLTREPFDLASAVDANGQPCVVTDKESAQFGKLTAFPANYKTGTHSALSKDDFAAEVGWWDYKAASAEQTLNQYQSKLNEYREKADICRKYGNEADRKRIQKLAAMREEYAKIAAECEKDGVEIPEELRALMGASNGG